MVQTGLFCAGEMVVPGVSKEVRCGVTSWIRTWPDSVMAAVRVVGGCADVACGVWCARIRFVQLVNGIDLVSNMGSDASSSESESSSSSSSFSMRDKLLIFMTMIWFSLSLPRAACVPATAYTVAGYVLRSEPRLSGTMSQDRQGHGASRVCSISYVERSGFSVSPGESL